MDEIHDINARWHVTKWGVPDNLDCVLANFMTEQFTKSEGTGDELALHSGAETASLLHVGAALREAIL